MSTAVRKVSCIILAAAWICAASAFGVAALKIDGVYSASEWKNSDVYVLDEQEDFGNGVKSAVVRLLNNEKSDYAGLMFMIEFEKDGNMDDGQIRIQLNGGDSAVISIGAGVTETGGLNIDAESECDPVSGCSITEAVIERKNGIRPGDVISVFITDLTGNESKEFIIEPETEEPGDTASDDENSKSEKTSKSRTTKIKTTKVKTSKSKTSKDDDFTFKKVDKNKSKSQDKTESKARNSGGDGTAVILEEDSDEKSDGRYIIIAAACVCALGVTIAAAAGAIKSGEEKDKKDK